MIEKILHNDELLAIIVRSKFKVDGIEFFTPSDFSQQLAYMKRPKGYSIQAHSHNKVHREVHITQEVLIIRSGRVRVDFYDQEKKYLQSYILFAGDVILLAAGGHGFHFIEESEIIEVKQGPFSGDRDKSRFPGIAVEQVTMKGMTND